MKKIIKCKQCKKYKLYNIVKSQIFVGIKFCVDYLKS